MEAAVVVRMPAESEQLFAGQSETLQVAFEVPIHPVEGERVVSRRHGCVRREHRGLGYAAVCLVGREPLFHVFAESLQGHERGVSLVGVPHIGVDPERPEHAYSADPEHDLLPEPHLVVAGVQLLGEGPVLGIVQVDVGVHQEDGRPADQQFPHAEVDGTAVQGHRRVRAFLPVSPHLANGHGGRIERLLDRELPSVLRHSLPEIALLVEQADADQGDAEVAGLLEVVAGQDSEPAGIDRDRSVHAELGAEVGDPARSQVTMGLTEPAASLLEHCIEFHGDRVVLAQKDRIARRFRHPGGVHPAQHLDGVLAVPGPQGRIETLKQGARVLVPRPPQVVGQALEARDSRGKVRSMRLVHSPSPWIGWTASTYGALPVPRRTTRRKASLVRLLAGSSSSEGAYARCVPRSCRGGSRWWRCAA